jgi:prevent-host-death family protein
MSRKPTKGEQAREAAIGYGTTEVPASELKNSWHLWLERVREGRQTIVVTRYGRPIATLAPYEPGSPPPSLFGSLRGSIVHAGDLVSPIEVDWESAG